LKPHIPCSLQPNPVGEFSTSRLFRHDALKSPLLYALTSSQPMFCGAASLQHLELTQIKCMKRVQLVVTTWGFPSEGVGEPGTSVSDSLAKWAMRLSAQVFYWIYAVPSRPESDQHEPHGYLIPRPIGCRRYIPNLQTKCFGAVAAECRNKWPALGFIG
jgi:hypothetical protein